MTESFSFEVVAVRPEGPHDHIVRVRLADGTEMEAADIVAEIESGKHVHYYMRRVDLEKPLLLQVRQCPDCLEQVLFA